MLTSGSRFRDIAAFDPSTHRRKHTHAQKHKHKRRHKHKHKRKHAHTQNHTIKFKHSRICGSRDTHTHKETEIATCKKARRRTKDLFRGDLRINLIIRRYAMLTYWVCICTHTPVFLQFRPQDLTLTLAGDFVDELARPFAGSNSRARERAGVERTKKTFQAVCVCGSGNPPDRTSNGFAACLIRIIVYCFLDPDSQSNRSDNRSE